MDQSGLSRSTSDSMLRSTWSGAPPSKEVLYHSNIRPFTGHPPDEKRLMAPHPLSPVRRDFVEPINEATGRGWSMKEVREIRKKCNFVLHNSSSLTFVPEAHEDGGKNEFRSFHTQVGFRRKHSRSPISPVDKYRTNAVSSHKIGWHAETDYGAKLTRAPVYGLTESQVTKNYQNMVCTNMDKCLRSCK